MSLDNQSNKEYKLSRASQEMHIMLDWSQVGFKDKVLFAMCDLYQDITADLINGANNG